MWDQCSLSLNQPINITPEIILAETDLASLASHIHVASMRECFDFMIVDWASVSPLMPSEVNSLWDTIQAVNTDLHKTLNEQVAVAAATKKQPRRRDAKLDGRGNEMGTIDKVDVELQGRGKWTKIRLECGVMMDEANWMDELKKPSRKPQKNLD